MRRVDVVDFHNGIFEWNILESEIHILPHLASVPYYSGHIVILFRYHALQCGTD